MEYTSADSTQAMTLGKQTENLFLLFAAALMEAKTFLVHSLLSPERTWYYFSNAT